MRRGLELGHLRVFQRGDDEENGVGAQRARLGDLVFVDDEFLAQHRQRTCAARTDQILRVALEKGPVGEHRKAGGARLLIGAGVRGRIKRHAA